MISWDQWLPKPDPLIPTLKPMLRAVQISCRYFASIVTSFYFFSLLFCFCLLLSYVLFSFFLKLFCDVDSLRLLIFFFHLDSFHTSCLCWFYFSSPHSHIIIPVRFAYYVRILVLKGGRERERRKCSRCS